MDATGVWVARTLEERPVCSTTSSFAMYFLAPFISPGSCGSGQEVHHGLEAAEVDVGEIPFWPSAPEMLRVIWFRQRKPRSGDLLL